jgi:1,4-dihydroxy-2-naphthoyl-CoA hydrolase
MSAPTLGPFTGFDALYGLEVLEADEEQVRAQVRVRDELLQPAGLVHGGVFASIAESICSIATWLAVSPDGLVAQGLSNQTSFLRPILSGTIHAHARRRHRGRSTWVWEVDITDDAGRLCSIVRMTVAVREAGAAGGAEAQPR